MTPASPLRILSLALATFLVQPAAYASPATVVVSGPPNEDVIAAYDGGLDAAIAALPGYVADVMTASGVPGVAVAVVHGGETVFADGFGVRQVGRGDPVDPSTAFQIASISKSVAATVAAIQVSAGVIDWDDPAAMYLDTLELHDPYVTAHATIGDFFAHRSGLPAAAGDDLEDLGASRADIIAQLALVPLDPFRTSYHYANFGTTIAAEAVAAASGTDWATLSETALYEPLDMTSTSSRHADFLSRTNRAHLHALQGGVFLPLFDRDPDQQSPAGGVSSSAIDLAEWMKLLLAGGEHEGGRLISEEALVTAMTPQAISSRARTLTGRSGAYGYGFNVGVTASGRTSLGHSGGFAYGGGTRFQIIPSLDVGIVVLTNGAPVGVAEAVAAQFLDIVEFGAPTRDWFTAYGAVISFLNDPAGDLAGQSAPPDPAPPQPLDAYMGLYDNDYFGAADIVQDDDGLVLILGPRGDRLDLEHWDGDVFAVSPVNENAPYGTRSSVRFDMTPGSPASAASFTVEYLDANGLAVWTR